MSVIAMLSMPTMAIPDNGLYYTVRCAAKISEQTKSTIGYLGSSSFVSC